MASQALHNVECLCSNPSASKVVEKCCSVSETFALDLKGNLDQVSVMKRRADTLRGCRGPVLGELLQSVAKQLVRLRCCDGPPELSVNFELRARVI